MLFRSCFVPNGFVTKGLPINNSDSLESIAVFGYYTGNGTDNWANKGSDATPDYFSNLLVSNEGYSTSANKWVMSQTYYWPSYSDANLTFFAYSPYIDTSSESNYYGLEIVSTTGGLKMKYTVPSYCAYQPDLMMALPRTDLNDSNNPGTVELNMKHALTAIGFTAEGSYDTINSINITNVSVSGEVSFNLTDTSFTWVLDDPSSVDNYAITENELPLTNTSQPVIKYNGYIMMPPQTLSDEAELIVEIKSGATKTISLAGQEWKAGDKVTYNLNARYNPATIDVDIIERGFVHAFWRHDETGERIIRMDATGKWEAFVLSVDDQWSYDDIMLDYLPSDYSTAQGQEINEPIAQITENKPLLSGDGNISFRIGLSENTTLTSADSKPRYAVVLIKYDNLSKNHLIYLRQGEACDVVNGSLKFSAFNLSSEKVDGTETYQFEYYPSVGGAYKQWNMSTIMYPYSTSAASNWNPGSADTTDIENICPAGYVIPSYDDFNTMMTPPVSGYSSYYGGLCADGYFDRQTLTNASEYGYQTESGSALAFCGFVVFNASTYASVFFPMAGRLNSNGVINQEEATAFYWTTTLPSESSLPYYFTSGYANNNIQIFVEIRSWCEKADANSIRPRYSGTD